MKEFVKWTHTFHQQRWVQDDNIISISKITLHCFKFAPPLISVSPLFCQHPKTEKKKETVPRSCYAELVEQVETLEDEKHQLEVKQKEIEEQNKTLQKKLEGGSLNLVLLCR